LGNGRTRTAMYTDRIEQLRGTAGARQVRVRAETALAAFATPGNGGWVMFGESPELTACDARRIWLTAHSAPPTYRSQCSWGIG
jgi:hypothetical protein